MADFDTPWKDILDFWFERFVAFFFPEIHAAINWARGYEFLDKELQKILPKAQHGRAYVDKLVKVWRRDGREEWILIHIEIQGRKEKRFGRRMYVYNTRLFGRYNRTVVSVAVLTDGQTNWRPREFGYDVLGCKVQFSFPMVKLLDWVGKEAALEADPNPFAIVVLAHLKSLETKDKPKARHGWKVRLVRGLYDRGLKPEQVRQLFLFIDWVIELPRALEKDFWQTVQEIEEEKHMPYVSSVERWAREEGREEGNCRTLRKVIRETLKTRFGKKGLGLLTKIEEVQDSSELHKLFQVILKADTLAEVEESLPS